MNRVAFLFTLLVLSISVRADAQRLRDGLSEAYSKAIQEIGEGKDTGEILNALSQAIEANPKSAYLEYAKLLSADLEWSTRNPIKADATPSQRLRETRVSFLVLSYEANWEPGLMNWMDKTVEDPVAILLKKDRAVITELIPALSDRSPIRIGNVDRLDFSWDIETIPRVCDIALAIIEYQGRCRFFRDTIFGQKFHQLKDDERAKIIRRVEVWWEENQHKSLAEGIRSQIPFANSYPEKVWMAMNLVRKGDGMSESDKEHGLSVLGQMMRDEPPFPVPAYVTHYLCNHGDRRAWELVYAISTERKYPDCVVHAAVGFSYHTKKVSPYAIPQLGLALSNTKIIEGIQNDEFRERPYSSADLAIIVLQKQTGKDFGYEIDASLEKRLSAIKRAEHWWTEQGKAKYSFDYIEQELLKKPVEEKK